MQEVSGTVAPAPGSEAMAQLFLQIATSLDGYIEDANHDIGWMVEDPSIDPFMTDVLRGVDGMIFGKTAHKLLAEFWPSAGEQKGASSELKAQAELMNRLPKYVLTHGGEDTGWNNSHAIRAEDVPRLKRDARRPIALYAGAGAAQALMDQLDEMRLIQYPILLGAGTPLFAEDSRRRPLRLLESRTFDSGAVLQRYAPA
jgi:dihydrofolate reductase